MSIKLMTAVWELPGLSQSEVLVMLALADFSNDDGSCWPSMQTIADRARVTSRGARGILRRLEERGFVITEESRGRTHSNRYRVELNPDTEMRNGVPVKHALKPERETRNDVPIKPLKPERERIKPEARVPPNLKEPSRKKESKNIKATPVSVLSSILSPEMARAVVEHRQRLRKPLTAKAAEMLLRKFEQCEDAEAGAAMMLERGWQSIDAEWMKPRDGRRVAATGKGDKANDRFNRVIGMATGATRRDEAEQDVAGGTGEGSSAPRLAIGNVRS